MPRGERVSSYQVRVERTLTDIFMEVPEQRQADQEWVLTHVAHTTGYAACELCGHVPIKRLFFIRSRSTGRELMIGSECARNYARVDLVEAYARSMRSAQSRQRRERQRLERIRVQREARERRAADERQAWETHPQREEMEQYLLNEQGVGIISRAIRGLFLRQGYLSSYHTNVLLRSIAQDRSREETSTPAQAPETPGDDGFTTEERRGLTWHAWNRADAVQVPNGIYVVADSIGGTTFKVYTIRHSTNAEMVGKRVVALWVPITRQWVPFGFLTTSGSVYLWRRFAEDENMKEHRKVASMVFATMRNQSLVEVTENGREYRGWTVVRGNRSHVVRMTQTNCLVCMSNISVAYDQVRLAETGLCANHYAIYPLVVQSRQQVLDQHTRRTGSAGLNVTPQARTREPAHGASSAPREGAVTRPVARTRPRAARANELLSEVDGKWRR